MLNLKIIFIIIFFYKIIYYFYKLFFIKGIYHVSLGEYSIRRIKYLITQKDIEGKIHVANFIFTSCGSICPVMTSHLKLLQQAFENNSNVVLLSYSVTPWIDSVPRLQQYAISNDIHSKNWHLLTGSKSIIYTLARTSYFAEEDLGFTKDSTQFLHTEHIILVDKNKRIRGVYNGTLQLETEQMVKDIQMLMEEKE
jgi:protein SCO1/2